jgi:hypothetical protein
MNFKELVARLDEIESTEQNDVQVDEPDTDLEKADELDDMVDQYIALNGTNDEFAEPDAVDQAVAEHIYESLVESFGYQAENFSSAWDEFNKYPIVTLPNGTVLYDGEDLITDLGLAAITVLIGPLAGPVVIPRLVKLAKLLEKTFVGARPASKEAISAIAKTYKQRLADSIAANLGTKAFAVTAGYTAATNALLAWAEHIRGDFNPANLGNKATMPSVDTMGNATGQSN